MESYPIKASWRRAFLLLLPVAACIAGLEGCAAKPQAQYKVYFCNMETTLVSEIRINYGGALWAIPPARAGDTAEPDQHNPYRHRQGL